MRNLPAWSILQRNIYLNSENFSFLAQSSDKPKREETVRFGVYIIIAYKIIFFLAQAADSLYWKRNIAYKAITIYKKYSTSEPNSRLPLRQFGRLFGEGKT